MKTKIVLVAMALVVLLVACAPAITPEPQVVVVEGGAGSPPSNTGVLRWCDSQASVVCWKWGYGLYCMPLKDTTLLECK